ncbi:MULTISPECIES: T9SS type B sorting domain-containing protein [unclassified Lacinutrix]
MRVLLVLLFLFSSSLVSGQLNGGASSCVTAEPICSSTDLSFLNTSDYSTAELGPDYGCLTTQPNPAWFFLQIGISGEIYLTIQQTNDLLGVPNLDVDFILYGPFVDTTEACNSGLTSSNIIDCSYSPNGVENVFITNAVSGEFYMLLVTNFSGESGVISINQNSGDGTTNCAILEGLKACEGESIALNAHTENAETYIWYEEDIVNPGSYLLIAGGDEEVFLSMHTNNYMAEVYDIHGGLLNVFEYEVEFIETPIVKEDIEPYIICDNLNENDGIGAFDLDSWNEEVLNGLNPDLYSVSYFSSEEDAIAHENQLLSAYVNTFAHEIIYVRIDNTASPIIECFSVGDFDLSVLLNPIVHLDNFYICENTNGTELIDNPILDTELSTAEYSFEWMEISNPTTILSVDSFYEPLEPGVYSVLVTNNSTGCTTAIDDENTISQVIGSYTPTALSVEVISEVFNSANVIEVHVNEELGLEGNYEFSLNHGVFEGNGNSYTFSDVIMGENSITVRDINGCGQISTSILVVDYPLVFTPNNDGYNDVWRITGINPDAVISIFDRYGKLIKQFNAASIGWDGTFNGQPVPPNDYWFSIEYKEPNIVNGIGKKEYVSHFTLKR